jgi:hypothetical protein
MLGWIGGGLRLVCAQGKRVGEGEFRGQDVWPALWPSKGIIAGHGGSVSEMASTGWKVKRN